MSALLHKINVCHLASGDLWAGAEVQVANVCRSLLDTGMVAVSAILLNNGRLAKELRSSGVDVIVIDEQRTAWWRILQQVTRHLRSRPVDILHTHRYKENTLGSLAAKRAGVPYIVRTVHGTTELYSGWKSTKIKVYTSLDNFLCRYLVDGVIGVSKEIADDLRWVFPGKAIAQIPNCIDERRLVPVTGRDDKRLQLGLKRSDFVIGTVGRLAPVKGTEYLIRAIPEIVKSHENVRVVIAGDGPLRGDLEELVRSLGLEKTVVFLGWRDDTVDIINTLDLFVLPSLHEGMPTVLLEAMSLGVPVVASATGGIPELVKDSQTGLLFETRCKSSIAEKCLRLILDSFLANELVKKAETEAARYSHRETVSSLLTFYQGIIDGSDA